MELREFIEMKTEELETQFRSVKLHSFYSVMLNDNSVGEKFTSLETSLTKQGAEVTRIDFPILPPLPFIENATEVRFEAIRKGKRKPERLAFYFLWT